MYQVPDSVRSTHGPDGAIVLAIDAGQVLRMNTAGSLIFQLLRGGRSETQIVAEVTQRFHLSPQVAHQDVCEFLRVLEQHGLVFSTNRKANANCNARLAVEGNSVEAGADAKIKP